MADERYEWLDRDAAEQLLRGEPVRAADEHARVQAARLGAALRGAGAYRHRFDDGELPGEAAALAAFRKARGDAAAPAGDSIGTVTVTRGGVPVRGLRFGRPLRFGIAAALAGCALGGVAVAAGTGVLPPSTATTPRCPRPPSRPPRPPDRWRRGARRRPATGPRSRPVPSARRPPRPRRAAAPRGRPRRRRRHRHPGRDRRLRRRPHDARFVTRQGLRRPAQDRRDLQGVPQRPYRPRAPQAPGGAGRRAGRGEEVLRPRARRRLLRGRLGRRRPGRRRPRLRGSGNGKGGSGSGSGSGKDGNVSLTPPDPLRIAPELVPSPPRDTVAALASAAATPLL
ncbi:hypothetical protein ACFQ60_29920 [Streptomyces zhihengii]